MGLLDDLPDSLLKPMRTAAQNRNPNVDLGADNAIDLPSWVPQRQPQRPPLSLAGPGLTADINVSSPGPSADALRTQQPAPTARNLTVQVLRMKGVPDADIAAATANPELMKQLIMQNYGLMPGVAPSPPPGSPQLQPVGLKCDGWLGCQSGGNYGYGAMYRVGNQNLCESCAVKKLGIETLPSTEKADILRPFTMGGGK
jgi:hypothetical protein